MNKFELRLKYKADTSFSAEPVTAYGRIGKYGDVFSIIMSVIHGYWHNCHKTIVEGNGRLHFLIQNIIGGSRRN
jgi:hypothetical protein